MASLGHNELSTFVFTAVKAFGMSWVPVPLGACYFPLHKIWLVQEQLFIAENGCYCQGLPYIPRVHLSEGSLVRSPLRWLSSEEPMVRRSFIPKFLYSESCYVPKIPYSERPSTIWILCYEDSLVRSSSSPKGAMFLRFYLPNFARSIRILCYEGSSWWYLNFSGHKILQYWYSVFILL